MFNGNLHTNLPATVRIRNIRTRHPDRTLSYLLKIICTLFQNREQNSIGCHAQFVYPTFVWRFPLNDSDILINSIPNCLRHIMSHLLWVRTRGGWSRWLIRSRALYLSTQGPQTGVTGNSAASKFCRGDIIS